MEWGGRRRYVLVGVLVVAVLVVFAVLYGELPWWIDGTRLRALRPQDQAGILGSDRGDVLKMVGGAGALVALVYTARRHALDREAQVTNRYSTAIGQTASGELSERVGGIYALERVMADSARDHPMVVEVLSAFVRQHAPDARKSSSQSTSGGRIDVHPEADVQAAMTVLARRPKRDEQFHPDLRRTVLAGMELPDSARFSGANFMFADLTNAGLQQAKLVGAELRNATLTDTDLWGADLSRASLFGVDLTEAQLCAAVLTNADLRLATLAGADLRDAKLTNADLQDATLTDADLSGANLVGVVGIDAMKLSCTVIDTGTVLDEWLVSDPWVLARIKACQDWTDRSPVPPTPDPSTAA